MQTNLNNARIKLIRALSSGANIDTVSGYSTTQILRYIDANTGADDPVIYYVDADGIHVLGS